MAHSRCLGADKCVVVDSVTVSVITDVPTTHLSTLSRYSIIILCCVAI